MHKRGYGYLQRGSWKEKDLHASYTESVGKAVYCSLQYTVCQVLAPQKIIYLEETKNKNVNVYLWDVLARGEVYIKRIVDYITILEAKKTLNN